MEENQENLLPDIIKKRKLLPFEVKRKIMNHIFYNCIAFIIMMCINIVINVAFSRFSLQYFESYVNAFQVISVIISIILLEIAYRKDSGTVGIYGIEFLLYSIGVLYVPYMYLSKGNVWFLRNVITGFVIYYVIKSIATFIYLRNKHIQSNISDVKEIVKEEKKGYLDEQSTKTLKLEKAEKELRKKVKTEKQKKIKEIKKKKEENKND